MTCRLCKVHLLLQAGHDEFPPQGLNGTISDGAFAWKTEESSENQLVAM